MHRKWLLLVMCAFGSSVLAQGTVPDSKPDSAREQRDAKNWEVLHSMYPKRALENREEGLVGFTVKIDAAGSPTECQVTHTSGHALLDKETCQLIMLHATFKRPEGLSPSQQRKSDGVVNWKLPTTPLDAVPARPKRIDAASAPEPIMCKRTQKSGSNAAFERTCMTERQWERARAETRQYWNEVGRQGATREDMEICRPGSSPNC